MSFHPSALLVSECSVCTRRRRVYLCRVVVLIDTRPEIVDPRFDAVRQNTILIEAVEKTKPASAKINTFSMYCLKIPSL